MLVKISEKSIAIIYHSSPDLLDFLRKWLLMQLRNDSNCVGILSDQGEAETTTGNVR